MALTDSEYPVLKLTAAARAVLLGEERVCMKVRKETQKAFDKGAKGKTAGRKGVYSAKTKDKTVRSEDMHIMQTPLFEKLKATRMRLATEEGVPAFVIFSDATLIDMCKKMPASRSSFLDVKGVGVMKQERYSAEFIDVIRKERE